MIRFLKHQEIDKVKWDACLEASPNGLIFGCSWVLDAAFPNWSGIVLGDYEAVWVIPMKKKMGIKYALNPFFIRHTGIFSKTELSAEEIETMIKAVPSSIKLLRLFMHPHNSGSWERHTKVHQYMPMNSNFEELVKGFSSNTKRNIKKAEKQNVLFQLSDNHKIVPQLFRSNKGGELEIFGEKDYLSLEKIMQACTVKNKGETYTISDEAGKVYAAGFFCIHNQTLTFLKGATSEEGKSIGAMHLLFSNVIKKYAGKVDILDFGGSNIEGVARFYKGFGGIDAEYIQVEYNRLPPLLRIWKS